MYRHGTSPNNAVCALLYEKLASKISKAEILNLTQLRFLCMYIFICMASLWLALLALTLIQII